MKIRYDFVTNSSSSSFIISKKYLTEDQIFAIDNHSEVGRRLNLWNYDCPWNIEENDYYIGGYTDLDNFSMMELFEKIGVNLHMIKWSDSGLSLFPPEGEQLEELEDLEYKEQKTWLDVVDDIKNGVPYEEEQDLELEELFAEYLE